ncbi:MAG: hypothetical protein KGQ41_06100 [Alphaproteobacteria bacterium]|nr:hypothetical protein [Alphaproteobacteria bacterium]
MADITGNEDNMGVGVVMGIMLAIIAACALYFVVEGKATVSKDPEIKVNAPGISATVDTK